MKIGDLVKHKCGIGDIGVIVKTSPGAWRHLVFYSSLIGLMGEEEQYQYVFPEEIELICEAG